jgi:hypothetical protein
MDLRGSKWWEALEHCIMRMRLAGHAASMGQNRNHNILVRKPKWKRPLGRATLRREDNIRMDVGDLGWEVVDWIHLVQDRYLWQAVVKTVMNLRIP